MSVTTFCLLVLAGVGAGLCGYLTGLASVVTYPALLAAGLSPVSANASNTLGVLLIGVGSSLTARHQLAGLGQRRLARDAAVAFGGGLVGGLLLLLGGDSAFASIVPWLVLLSSLALLAQPRITKVRGEVDQPRTYLFGLFLTCIYGGYFGAGAGVVFLVLALLTTQVGFTRSMMLKSFLLAVSNLAASLVFVVGAPIDWWAAVATGIGCFAGGRLGPRVQRLVPQWLLRLAVALGGVGLACWLWASS